MKANYHSHTTRCGHARGTEREFVEKAIENGFSIWGFSDHTPYPFDPGFRSGIRMEVGELDSYVQTVLDLKKEYEKDIQILLGLEVEYYAIVNGDTLLDIREWEDASHVVGCITVYCGKTPIRLIDHIKYK